MSFRVSLCFLISFSIFSFNSEGRSCEDQIRNMCQGGEESQLALRTNDDNTIVLNPNFPMNNILSHPAIKERVATSPQGMNLSHFNTKIKPLFEKLKSIVQRQINAMPNDAPLKKVLMKKISQLKLVAENWGKGEGRCQRNSNPFAASIQDTTIRICPWMTHLDHRSLLTILAHELGHFMDPCKQWEANRALELPIQGMPFQNINQCLRKDHHPKLGEINPYDIDPQMPVNESSCNGFRHEELHADYVGSHLASEFLTESPEFFNGYSDSEIGSSLFYYRLYGCDIKPNDPALAMLQVSQIQKTFKCDSYSDVRKVCSNQIVNEETRSETPLDGVITEGTTE